MFHGITNRDLYASYRVETIHSGTGTRKEGIGTGFFVVNKANQLCFVTNRHVFDLAYKDNKYRSFSLESVCLHGFIERTGEPVTWKLENLNEVIYHPNPRNDIACIRQPIVSSERDDENVDCYIAYETLATRQHFEGELSVCDFIAFAGYAPGHDRRGGRAVFRGGTIASDPRFDYSWTADDKGDCLAYEAFSYPGSSGSPVYSLQLGMRGVQLSGVYRPVRLIGINAGHVSADYHGHSGISYLYKSYAIAELIDSGL